MKTKTGPFLSNRPYSADMGKKYHWMRPKKSGLPFFEFCDRIDEKKAGVFMKNKWGYIPIIAIVLLVLVALGVRIWFISPGIRVVGNDIHVELTQKCFIIDGQSGEMLDETTVTVEGATSRRDRQLFDGELKIIGYQNSATGTITALKSIEKTEDGNWIITHLENCTHREEDENGVIKDVEHFCDYSYTYYLYPEDPGKLVVLIESFDQYQPMYAVCADNEEAALERYEEFMKQRL